MSASLLIAEGKIQSEGKAVHLIAKRCFNLSSLLSAKDIYYGGRKFK